MPPAISPVGPRTTNNPPERIPPPAILGVNDDKKDVVAYKEGDYQQERLHEKIYEAIAAFHWASQELGGTNLTPNKAKRPEISENFRRSASTLDAFTSNLGILIKELEAQKKHNLSNTIALLKHQYEALKLLTDAHKQMSNPRSSIDGIFADGWIRNGRARKLIDQFLQIAQVDAAEPNVRQDALGHIKNGLGGIPSAKVAKAIDSYKTKISGYDDFLTSPSVQALTKSLGGRARVAAQNPNSGLVPAH